MKAYPLEEDSPVPNYYPETFQCPHCGIKIVYPVPKPRFITGKFRCPKCNELFDLEKMIPFNPSKRYE